MKKLIHVAAAAIFNSEGQVLLALRNEKQHQGGLWEFPGGKVESGETVRGALARELQEELGIEIEQSATRPLIQVPYHYSDKSVLLDVYKVCGFTGEPHGAEGQPLEWVSTDCLSDYAFPAANTPIVNALLLPESIAITGVVNDISDYLRKIKAALSRADKVMFRAADMLSEQRLDIIRQLQNEFPDKVIVNGSLMEAAEAKIKALHLNSDRLMALTDRAEFNGVCLSASCHNHEQLQKAVDLGLDFVTLSPVKPTSSHPEKAAIGWESFAELANAYPIPVYALGGMQPEDLDMCWESGGQGICAISAYWS